MPVNYLSYTLRAHDILKRLGEILDLLEGADTEEWKRTVRRLDSRLETMRFQVAVVGEFKRGKTSFINALLRSEILPADVVPATATINRVTYGNAPRSLIRWKDGRPDQEVGIGELSRFITKLTDESAENARRIKEAVVYFPCMFCENNVDLIDTPGMNDNDDMNAVTIGELSDIDLAIVTLDPKYPVSTTEAAFIAKLIESDQICQVIFIASKIDTVPESQRGALMDTVCQRLRTMPRQELVRHHGEDGEILKKCDRLLSEPVIFPVSPMMALTSFETGDTGLYEKSGFQRLCRELPPLIITTQHRAAVLTPLNMTAGICRRIAEICAVKAQKADLDRRRGELRRSFADTAYAVWVDAEAARRMAANGLMSACRERQQRAYTEILSASSSGGSYAAVETVKNIFRSLKTELPGEERQLYRLIWEQYFLTGYGSMAAKLKSVMESGADAMAGEPPDLEAITCPYDGLPVRYDDSVEFYFLSTPAPPAGMPPGQRGYHIQKALNAAFNTYYEKRYRRVTDLIDKMISYEAGQCEQAVMAFFKITPQASDGAGSSGDRMREAENAARRLIKDCAALSEQYLNEIEKVQ